MFHFITYFKKISNGRYSLLYGVFLKPYAYIVNIKEKKEIEPIIIKNMRFVYAMPGIFFFPLVKYPLIAAPVFFIILILIHYSLMYRIRKLLGNRSKEKIERGRPKDFFYKWAKEATKRELVNNLIGAIFCCLLVIGTMVAQSNKSLLWNVCMFLMIVCFGSSIVITFCMLKINKEEHRKT